MRKPRAEVSLRRRLSKTAVHLLLIAALGVLVYSNTFHVPFQWDEANYIVKNRIVRDLGFFAHPSEAARFELYKGFASRYVGFLTFALNYRVNGFDVAGYHIINLTIHITNALLVYLLVLLTFRTPFLARAGTGKSAEDISFITALLFVCHPVQTEAVTYIFQRFASLVSLFYLLSIVMYAKGRLTASEETLSGQGREGEGKEKAAVRRAAFYLFSAFSAVLAMKTKENAFTLPVVIILYEFLFFEGPLKKRAAGLVPLLFTMPIIPLTLARIEKPAGGIFHAMKNLASVGYIDIPRADYLFTQFRVIVTYIRLLFLPVNQNLDYDYPVAHSFFSAGVIVPFLFLIFVFCLGLFLLFRSRTNRGSRLIGFGILWFYITLSVESSIIPIPMVICEYRAYLPSVGFFLAITAALFSAMGKLGKGKPDLSKAVIATVVILLVVLSGKTYARNQLWGDSVGLWGDTLEKSPGKARVYFTLATVYDDKGKSDKAVSLYKRAIELDPDYSDAFNNLGTIYDETGLYDKAIGAYEDALRIRPDDHEVLNNLGAAYINKGEYGKAVEVYKKAVAISPDAESAHYNLGIAFASLGRKESAIREYTKSVLLSPDDGDAYYQRGLVYADSGNIEGAMSDLGMACRLGISGGCARLRELQGK